MGAEPPVDCSVARYRPSRGIALWTLFLVAVSAFSPRAQGDFSRERDSAGRASIGPSPAAEPLAAYADELIDPLEDDDLSSDCPPAPAFYCSESPADFNHRSASPDRQATASSNPARAPPSA